MNNTDYAETSNDKPDLFTRVWDLEQKVILLEKILQRLQQDVDDGGSPMYGGCKC